MKLVIDIPYYVFEQIKRENTIKNVLNRVDFAIRNGVERPHGEWLPKYDDNGGRRYVCSICGEPCYTLLWTEPEPRDRFCLWCGADMRTQNDRSWDTSERGVSGSVKNSIAQEEGEAE